MDPQNPPTSIIIKCTLSLLACLQPVEHNIKNELKKKERTNLLKETTKTHYSTEIHKRVMLQFLKC